MKLQKLIRKTLYFKQGLGWLVLSFCAIFFCGTSALGNIDKNFWRYGAWGNLTAVQLLGGSNALLNPNITFLPNNPTFWIVPFIDPNTEACGVEYNATSIKPKDNLPLAIETFDTSLCNSLRQKGESYNERMMYQQEYDTLRKYIELCALQYLSYTDFDFISGALSLFADSSQHQTYIDAREWYKKVLYYNHDTNYYCADVIALVNTFKYFEGRGYDYLGSLAVLKYLKDNHTCLSWYELKHYDTLYANDIDKVISIWRDSVKDSLKTPLDTTLPSIDELGLGILRGQNGVVSASGKISSAIANLSLVENPFHSEAILRYSLNSSAMVRIDIYDALGRRMAGEGEGYKHEGEYQLSFDARTWSSGGYYIRLSTMSGEVKTVKLMHEK